MRIINVKTALLVSIAALLLVLGPWNNDKKQENPQERQCQATAGSEEAIQRFSKLLTYETLADARTPDHRASGYEEEFTKLLNHLEEAWPEVYRGLQVEKVGLGGGSRLYTWHGRDPSLRPVLFISHFDVVPVTPGTEQDWVHPPFSGAIEDGYIWGRGALDVKFSVAALLEAASSLLQKGFQPQRTLMMSFGNDEEVGGSGGAQLIAQYLAEKGVQLELIIDEGGLIISDGLKGVVDQPLALVATAEKVYTSVELDLASKGGHSSMPPIDKSDIASQAARMVQAVNTEPMPGEIRPPISGFLEAISHYLNPSVDYAFVRGLLRTADKWPLNKILAQFFLRSSSELAALVRTTVAVTRVSAGVADNVLPNIGQMIFNMRAHPETPRKDVLAYLEDRMKEANLQPGAKLQVTDASHFGPVPGVSPADGPGYKLLKQAIQEHWRHQGQGIAVAPYLLTGALTASTFHTSPGPSTDLCLIQ